tara:strand:- start:243 stop:437 length:195 start_codon:yes stop_codon:yes gene_type:complete
MNITNKQKSILLEHLYHSLDHLTDEFSTDMEEYKEDIELFFYFYNLDQNFKTKTNIKTFNKLKI